MTLYVDMHQVVVLSKDIGLAFEVNYTWMIATVAVSRTHDISLCFPLSCRRVAHGIAKSFRAAGRGESKVILVLAHSVLTFVEPWSFLIVLYLIVEFNNVALGRNHIIIQLHIIGIRIAPVHICLPVIINKNRRVYIFPVLTLPYEWFAERVLERSVW